MMGGAGGLLCACHRLIVDGGNSAKRARHHGTVLNLNVVSRIVQFTGESKRPGIGFLVGRGDDQRLVTARHLCIDEPEEIAYIRHPYSNNGHAFQAALVRVGRDVAPTADFAVFRLPEPIRVSKNASDDVPVNSTLFMYQQAFILGYPYGLSFMPKDSFQEFPIVKSCIIAGNRTGEDGVAIFYIDTIVNPGFSGGPLCFIDKKTQQPKFAGVVAKGMLAPIREPTVDDPNPPQGPAGIGVVVGEINFRDALKPDAH